MKPDNQNHTPLGDIIRQRRIHTRFQSIVDLRTMMPMGHEALSCGAGNLSPVVMFEIAEQGGLLGKLESLCATLACERYRGDGEHRLFLNVHPEALLDTQYRDAVFHTIMQSQHLSPSLVTLELSERQSYIDRDGMARCLGDWREHGFTFAVDDVGIGYSGLHRLVEIQPEYIKLDRYFAEAVHRDANRRAIVRGMVSVARSLGARVIAEGVEGVEEAVTLRELGIDLMQGYLFERPSARVRHQRFTALPAARGPVKHQSPTISHLVVERVPAEAATRLEQVIERFHEDPDLWSIPVVKNDRPLGVITRSAALDLYTRSFGKELHGRKAVAQFIDQAPLIVSSNTTLSAVSYELTESTDDHLVQEFIVERDGHYLGLVKTGDLLRQITDQQIRNARYANPLTLLPGNVPINEHVEQLLARRGNFHVGYCDINDFKAFNDAYGYARGDEAIKLLAAIATEHCDGNGDFVGHVGGDDFVLVLRDRDAEARCRLICTAFRQQAQRLYDHRDIEQGGIWSTDRSGARHFFSTMSLSIGLVSPDASVLDCAHEVSALATAAKKQAKTLRGGGVFVSRRRS
ncbi:bifunctional diguanylate cyclase/phosphodiesterase [Parahaliea mediterranea]|uniref:EAL and GGDEF domain-containing protein n=1 Tax=Parahaliea mediterranea TaxID=651086 RepID=A0A939ILQ1_9GAMM|nr:bifunctional diguanylate cyclase/phosphodiesterase [Parahaliea mediterranea]MBN7796202.1 EAL and GGDEF domain-containing protein [Parahaliea mediterranea]